MSAGRPLRERIFPWIGCLWALPGFFSFLQPGLYVGNGTDFYSYQYPLRATVATLWRAGKVPWWNPYVLTGVPALAGWQLGLLYPPHLLNLLFPYAATELLVWAHVALLGAGFAALIQTWRPTLAPWLCALVAAGPVLSGPTWGHAWAGHVSYVEAWAWLPWIWRAAVGFLDRRRPQELALGAAFLALQLLAGHPQVSYFTVLGLPIVMAARVVSEPQGGAPPAPGTWLGRQLASTTAAVGLLAMGGGAAILAAAQLGPTLDLLPTLNRTLSTPLEVATSYSAPAASLWTLWAPGVWGGTAHKLSAFSYHETVAYVGTGVLALALAGLASGIRGIILGTGVAFALLMAPGEHGPLLTNLLGVLPGAGSFRVPGRWVTLAVALIALLAADGLPLPRLPRLPPASTGRQRWQLAILVGTCLWLAWSAIGVGSPQGWFAQVPLKGQADALAMAHAAAKNGLWLAALAVGGAALAIARPGLRAWLVPSLCVLSAGQGLAFAADHLDAATRRPLAALSWSGPDRAALAQIVPPTQRLLTSAPLRQADWGGSAGIAVAGGYEPASTAQANRLGNVLAGRAVESFAVQFQARAPNVAVERMAVSHLLADPGDAATQQAFASWPIGQTLPSGNVLRANPHPRSRFEAVTSYERAADAQAVPAQLAAHPDLPVIVSGALVPPPPGGDAGKVTATLDSPSRQELAIDSIAGCVAVVRDAMARGWQVEVDGAAAPALVADGLFRAVAVPAGHHTVTWRYGPPTWPWTPAVSLVGWLALLAWLARANRRTAGRSAD